MSPRTRQVEATVCVTWIILTVWKLAFFITFSFYARLYFSTRSSTLDRKLCGRGDDRRAQTCDRLIAYSLAQHIAFLGLAMLAPTSCGAREIVNFTGFSAGMIVVKTRRAAPLLRDRRRQGDPLSGGVGRAGMAWSGTASIDGKYIKPAWSPPDMIRRENPRYRTSSRAAARQTRWARRQ